MAQREFDKVNIKVEFNEAETRQQINSGESVSTLFGKIKKIFSDLKTVAFTGSYNDLDDKPTYVLGVKGSSETTYRTDNVNITATNIGLGNVENKSSATIRSELTKENVTTALGYTPPTTNTTYSNATQSAAGLESAADKTKLDGIEAGANNYSLPAANSTVRGGVKIGYTENGKNYPVQLSNEQMYVNVPWTDTNTTYSNFVKSGSGAKAGLVPAPSTTAGTTKYLREDGTWTTPPNTNTTYSNMTGASASAAGTSGLVPAPAAGNQTKYLRGDGTWQTPTNTTYSNATTTTAGLMSSEDKVKLNNLTTNISLWSSGEVPVNGSILVKPTKGYYYIVTLSTSNPPHSIWLVSMNINYYQYNVISKLLNMDSSPSIELAYPQHPTHPESTGIIIKGCDHSATYYKVYQLPF